MNTIEKAKSWVKQSITVKLITISIIMLCLLIPRSMITSLIYERKASSQNAIKEVSSKWAGNQKISGPILTIPLDYKQTKEVVSDDDDSKTKTKLITWTSDLRILPSELNITGEVIPTERNRGIYKILLYDSDLNLSGKIKIPEFNQKHLDNIRWKDAYITLAISDLRGIQEKINFKLNDHILPVESGSKISEYSSGITMACSDLEQWAKEDISFSVDLNLQGSGRMDFTPDGDVTQINIKSSWPDPSFDGYVLPDDRIVTDEGFEATWKLLQLNRNYPSSWTNDENFIRQTSSRFGFTMYESNDHYQKSLRSAKYGAMIIGLNFLVFFLVEILNKKRIHPLQYILVGLALTIFFTMLLALSEHITYNMSFLLSASTTILLVSLYTKSVLGSWRLAGMMGVVLTGIYGFLFFTLLSNDYALLIGTIGLTAILGATMYFTRNIQWYEKIQIQTNLESA